MHRLYPCNPAKMAKHTHGDARIFLPIITVRTFAIRFADGMDAILWKAEVESCKLNNRRVRRGLDIPDLATTGLDDICSDFKNSTTL